MNIGLETTAEAAIAARRDHETIERMETWLSDAVDRAAESRRGERDMTERAYLDGEEKAYRKALETLRGMMSGGGV